MTDSKIYSVDSIDLKIIHSQPPQLVICANGRVVSTGWSHPRLSPYTYVAPPTDGIQEFDFLAKPPSEDDVVARILTPIHTDHNIKKADLQNYWGKGIPLLGVRIFAVGNSKQALLNPPEHMKAPIVMEADAVGNYVINSDLADVSFEADIKDKFRLFPDVISMRGHGIDLHDYESVRSHAGLILERLERPAFSPGAMPCDGRWPEADIVLFKSWIEAEHPV